MALASDMLRRQLCILALVGAGPGGCAVLGDFQPSVLARPIAPQEYLARQRADILSTGQLSAPTTQTLLVTGLNARECATLSSSGCIPALADTQGIADERKLSALAELWLQRAIMLANADSVADPAAAAFAPWMEAARHAYAYLFFTPRSPGERAFEDRQTQVRDWYNYAVQQAIGQLFERLTTQARLAPATRETTVRMGHWSARIELEARLPDGVALPRELLPASSLAFQGLRSTYRRDGFGAELVAVMARDPARPRAMSNPVPDRAPQGTDRRPASSRSWSEMPSPNLTAVFLFDAHKLDELLRIREVVVSVHDPLVESVLNLHGHHVPLAGNFTAGYALWLARSGFTRQSLHALLGRDDGIGHPHIYMMQPFDPDRRIIVMLHGLASSPEAWVNVANEILGDEKLRSQFQVWLIHYPTNMPVVVNHATIRWLLEGTLRNFDPHGQAAASCGLIVLGHSMGGMIARLMVSSTGQELRDWALADPRTDPDHADPDRSRLDPMLRFQPFPGVTRAIFIATPHRGTAVAGSRPARWLSRLIRLPLTTIEYIGDALQARAAPGYKPDEGILATAPNSIDNLDERDPFVQAAADLSISPGVRYHSIIARSSAGGPLEDSDDGLVPYRSAHLAGAASEKIIVSGHSVQESAASILEIRRILRQDMATHRRSACSLTH